jgi:hypothetical protein
VVLSKSCIAFRSSTEVRSSIAVSERFLPMGSESRASPERTVRSAAQSGRTMQIPGGSLTSSSIALIANQGSWRASMGQSTAKIVIVSSEAVRLSMTQG